MKHNVRDGKDVIHNGIIYRCDSLKQVDLPVRVENPDITPVEDDTKLIDKSIEELKKIASEKGISFVYNISKVKLIERIEAEYDH